ncbi:MAG: hypothetical protein ACO1RT_13275 [Planctomycetaceae bacterium]
MNTEAMQAAIIDYLLREQKPIYRGTLCRELELIGLVGGDLPNCPQWDWQEQLTELIQSGTVIECDRHCVVIDRRRVSNDTKPRPATKATRVDSAQGTLF